MINVVCFLCVILGVWNVNGQSFAGKIRNVRIRVRRSSFDYRNGDSETCTCIPDQDAVYIGEDLSYDFFVYPDDDHTADAINLVYILSETSSDIPQWPDCPIMGNGALDQYKPQIIDGKYVTINVPGKIENCPGEGDEVELFVVYADKGDNGGTTNFGFLEITRGDASPIIDIRIMDNVLYGIIGVFIISLFANVYSLCNGYCCKSAKTRRYQYSKADNFGSSFDDESEDEEQNLKQIHA